LLEFEYQSLIVVDRHENSLDPFSNDELVGFRIGKVVAAASAAS
jgi:hypothetical protein